MDLSHTPHLPDPPLGGGATSDGAGSARICSVASSASSPSAEHAAERPLAAARAHDADLRCRAPQRQRDSPTSPAIPTSRAQTDALRSRRRVRHPVQRSARRPHRARARAGEPLARIGWANEDGLIQSGYYRRNSASVGRSPTPRRRSTPTARPIPLWRARGAQPARPLPPQRCSTAAPYSCHAPGGGWSIRSAPRGRGARGHRGFAERGGCMILVDESHSLGTHGPGGGPCGPGLC